MIAGVVRTTWGQVDVCNGSLTCPSQMDNDLFALHRISGCARWYREPYAKEDVDHQTTTSVVSRAAAISVQMPSVKVKDMSG